MILAYQAYDKTGKPVADTIDAAGETEARENLRRQGLFVTQITAADNAVAGTPSRLGRLRHRKSGKLADVAMFSRQLYVLIASGTPVVQAIAALEKQAKNLQWAAVLADLKTKVEEGAPLSRAMEDHPEYFDSVCRSLVSAGESGSCLEAMLDRLATLTRKQLHTRRAVVGALVYPCLLIVVAVAVLGLLLTFVVPRFSELFASLDVPLPVTTRALIAVSEVLRNYWWAALAVLAGIPVALRFYLKGPGREKMDGWVLKLPQVGRVVRSLATARISRLLGVLLESRVPVLEALELARQSTGNSRYSKLIADAADAVSRGEAISSAFSATDLVSPSVTEAIRSGEQSGQVGKLLLNISDFLDEENEVIVRSLTSILEPILLVLLGLLVGLVAMSIFMPLFDLTSITQGGGG
jgi:type II secretory pathway component PulF